MRQSLKLHPLAKTKCAELLQKTKHRLTIEDYEHICTLNGLVEKVVGVDEATRRIVNLQVRCGNLMMGKPSVGKLFWFNEYALDWFKGDTALCDLIFAYLLATPNDDSIVRDLCDAEATRTKIFAWAKGITATQDDFETAIARVYPVESSGDGDGDCGPLFALLSREYGQSPDYWMWIADKSTVETMIDDYVRRVESEAAALRKAKSPGGSFYGGSAKPIAPSITPKMRHIHNLRKYLSALEKRWSANVG